MGWDRAGDALAEVLLTVQRILLPWVSVSKHKAGVMIKEMKEGREADLAALIREEVDDDSSR